MTGFTALPLSIQLDVFVEFVTVTSPDKKTLEVITFIDENKICWFRFSSREPGQYSFSYSNGDKTFTGSFTLEKYVGNDPLFTHGRIIAKKDIRYLEHADGTPFFWLADTWWYAMTQRASWPDVFQKIVAVRKEQGFSVSQVVVGYPPEVSLNSDNAKNSRGFPFLPSGEINPEYFIEVDTKIVHLIENGIVPCIFGGWGHHLDILGKDAIKKLWREIIARYAAYPVVFCLAGEVDLFPPPGYASQSGTSDVLKKTAQKLPNFLKKILKKTAQLWQNPVATIDSKVHLKNRIIAWNEVAEYSTSVNPFSVPLTAHITQPTTVGKLFNDPPWLDIDSFQSGHSYERREMIVSSILPAVQNGKKIINLEPWYEQITGQFGASDQRYAFWMSILAGATGASYGAHGLWNMARNNDGFMTHWGASDWKEAVSFPGAEQIGLAKKFLVSKKWWLLEPIPKIISPHWQVSQEKLPCAAKIESEILIYFPAECGQKTFAINTQLLPMRQCTLTWFDPTTLLSKSTSEFSETESKIIVPFSEDGLLSITWTEE